jgi:membrane peptidoglycan carboxypeptidase
VRRVLDGATAATLTEILRGVVVKGTGHRAAIAGYAVAGKTGTARRSSPAAILDDRPRRLVRGLRARLAPALVILVSLDTPKGPANEGGDVAAPLFARIAEPALRRLAVPRTIPTACCGRRGLRRRTCNLAAYQPPPASHAARGPARTSPARCPTCGVFRARRRDLRRPPRPDRELRGSGGR